MGRLKNWNYASSAWYFITICTAQKHYYFGHIEKCELVKNEISKLASEEWYRTPIIRPDMNISLGDFVVMPNHIHGLIHIGINPYNARNIHVRDHRSFAMHREATNEGLLNDEPIDFAMESTSKIELISPERIELQMLSSSIKPHSKNLASIVRGYKSVVTKFAKIQQLEFKWQSKYFDHIVRSKEELYTISKYIRDNPINWQNDPFRIVK